MGPKSDLTERLNSELTSVPDIEATEKKPQRKSTSVKQISKLIELFVLGVIVGLFSIPLSFLWKGYAYKASDLMQYITAERFPRTFQQPLPFKFVLIDIGEVTCAEWAKDYNGLCAALPHFPHDKLLKLFRLFKRSEPKLVVVDLDLRSEVTGLNPLKLDVSKFSRIENEIRNIVKSMKNTAFLVAQPLIKQPREGERQYYDYIGIGTILHELDAPNLHFGQVEQVIGDDGVLRSFPTTERILIPDSNINPDPPNRGDFSRVEHLALRVCELVTDDSPCGHRSGKDDKPDSGGRALHFGTLIVDLDDEVQFRYLLARDMSRLGELGGKRFEAISADAPAVVSQLRDAVVVLGSTALGRGDYHLTPLDVLGGETSGVVVLANEVVAALQNKWLVSPQLATMLLEKIALIIVSTVVVFLDFGISGHNYLHRPRTVSDIVF